MECEARRVGVERGATQSKTPPPIVVTAKRQWGGGGVGNGARAAAVTTDTRRWIHGGHAVVSTKASGQIRWGNTVWLGLHRYCPH